MNQNDVRSHKGQSHARYVMDSGQTAAKAAFEVVQSANGFEIHQTDEPNAPGLIVDTHGAPMVTRGWMARLSDKAAEVVPGTTKGFIALMAIVPSAGILIIAIATILVGFGRSDGTNTEKLNQIIETQRLQGETIKDIQAKQQDQATKLIEQEKRNAKLEGIDIGMKAAGGNK